MLKSIDARLAYRNRTLRTLPGKLLLGPTGRRLFADYLDKVPGFWGRIDFIHKLNLPGLFRVDVSAEAEQMEAAEAVWYPSHLHLSVDCDTYSFAEDKFITYDDIAVSCQTWQNHSCVPLTLRLSYCDELNFTRGANGCSFIYDVPSHDLILVGAAAADGMPESGCMTLAPGSSINFTIAAAVDHREHSSQADMCRKASEYLTEGKCLARQITEYEQWFSDVPSFECSDPLYATTYWYRWYILRNSYAEPDIGNFHHGTFYEGRSHKTVKDICAPWGHEFTQLIPLSTPLHLTDARWKHDGEPCRQAVQTLLDSMDEDGIFRTMMLDKFSFTFGQYNEWAVYLYALIHGDSGFLQDVLPGLKRNVRGVWDAFRGENDDLQIAYNHRRTGKEYQPSFWYFRDFPNNALDEAGYDWLKRVDLSVYLYLNALGTARLCHRVGDADEEWFTSLARRVREQILSKMWDSESGFFYDLHHASDVMALVKSVVGIYPLWANITDDEHLCVIDKLLDPALFSTGSAFASVARDCPVFMPQGSWKGQFLKGRDGCMWAGPSWPYTTCIALDAIAEQSKHHDHRYDADFVRLLREYSWEHYRNQSLREPYLVEHYNAITGEMLSDDVDYNHSFYIDLIIRHIAGLNPTENGFTIAPVDAGLEWFTLNNLRLQGHDVALNYRRGRSFRVDVDGCTVWESPALANWAYSFDKQEAEKA